MVDCGFVSLIAQPNYTELYVFPFFMPGITVAHMVW